MKTNQINMTEGPIFTKLIKFSFPLIFSGLLQLLFNAADIVVVGRFAGDNSLAAVGSTGPLINMLINLFVGISIGANVVAGNYFGRGDKARLERTVHTTMLLSVYSGIILTVAGVLLTGKILVLMQSPEDVLPLASLYLRILFSGVIAATVYNFGGALLRAKGDTKRPLYILCAAGVINVILNLIFVICFNMGVAGVAFATVLSQLISAVCIVYLLVNEEDGFKLSFGKLKVDWDIFIQILKIGIPAGIQGIIFSFSNVIIQSSVNSFGAVRVAGNSAAQSVEGFVYIAMNGFAQGILTFTSQNNGAGKVDRIKKAILITEICVLTAGLVLGDVAYFTGSTLLKMYSKNGEVIACGVERLSIICTTYFLCGMMDCMANVIRGMGYSLSPMLITLAGVCVIRMLWIFTVFQLPAFHTCLCIYMSYPISWFITLIVLTVFFVAIAKKSVKNI